MNVVEEDEASDYRGQRWLAGAVEVGWHRAPVQAPVWCWSPAGSSHIWLCLPQASPQHLLSGLGFHNLSACAGSLDPCWGASEETAIQLALGASCWFTELGTTSKLQLPNQLLASLREQFLALWRFQTKWKLLSVLGIPVLTAFESSLTGNR